MSLWPFCLAWYSDVGATERAAHNDVLPWPWSPRPALTTVSSTADNCCQDLLVVGAMILTAWQGGEPHDR